MDTDTLRIGPGSTSFVWLMVSQTMMMGIHGPLKPQYGLELDVDVDVATKTLAVKTLGTFVGDNSKILRIMLFPKKKIPSMLMLPSEC